MQTCSKCSEFYNPQIHPNLDGKCYWCATLRDRQPDQHQLIFRVVGYYRNTLTPGGNTIIASGHMTEYDARKLLPKMVAAGVGIDFNIQRNIQGWGWTRSPEYDEMINSRNT